MSIDCDHLVDLLNTASDQFHAYRKTHWHLFMRKGKTLPCGYLCLPRMDAPLSKDAVIRISNTGVEKTGLTSHQKIGRFAQENELIDIAAQIRGSLRASHIFDRPDFWGSLAIYTPAKTPRFNFSIQGSSMHHGPLTAKNLVKKIQKTVEILEMIRERPRAQDEAS